MLEKPLEQITYPDLEELLLEKWPEGKTVDYKRDVYGRKDEDKRELLKDASSFANADGGHILIGVDEDQGVPTRIPGVIVADADKEKLWLGEVIRRGIEPRIEFDIHAVPTPTGAVVFIIRVKESLLSPHRVVFQGKQGEFWARGSAEKYSMDVDELRRAFTRSEAVFERMQAFRHERVARVVADETPLPLMPGGRLILHLLPVRSFRSRQVFDVRNMPNLPQLFPPLGRSSYDCRLNLDGIVAFAGGRQDGGTRTYTQFFRDGSVEVVFGDVVTTGKSGKLLQARTYEGVLSHGLQRFLNGFREVKIVPPIWGFMTVTGVKGAKIPADIYRADNHYAIDRDVLWLPEFVIEDLSADATALLLPNFDLVWNASGFARSANFDTNGHWIGG